MELNPQRSCSKAAALTTAPPQSTVRNIFFKENKGNKKAAQWKTVITVMCLINKVTMKDKQITFIGQGHARLTATSY